MKFVLAGFSTMIFVISFFVAILADHPLISVGAIFAMILSATGMVQGAE